MGVYINLLVSEAVTEEEWESVYQESLILVDKLNLAEISRRTIHGSEVECFVRSIENEKRRIDHGFSDDWNASADYTTGTSCEDNGLTKDMELKGDPNSVDPMLSYYMEFGDEDISMDPKWNTDCWSCWWGKTQGRPQHISLLAIALMIESRLPGKVYVYGDINEDQCEEAVRRANGLLDEQISEPEQWDYQRLYIRINRFPISEVDKLRILNDAYQGIKAEEYGAFLREVFNREAIDQWWKDEFNIADEVMEGDIHDYLAQGFGIEHLFDLIEPDERIIRMILDTDICNEEKAEDMFARTEREPDIPFLVHYEDGYHLHAAHHIISERHFSLERLRTILREKASENVNTDRIIDDYLNEKELNEKKEEKEEPFPYEESLYPFENNEHDIPYMDYIRYYEQGDRIKPAVLEECDRIFRECRQMLAKSEFRKLKKKTTDEQFASLATKSSELLIRDKDWEKIYRDMVEHPVSFGRYWAAFHYDIKAKTDYDFLIAYVVNDELYHFLDRHQKLLS